VTAWRVLLDGLVRGADILELVSELAPLHPRNNTFPGEVFLHVAADALDWCRASRADPLPLEGLRERFLPECTFRGRQNTRTAHRRRLAELHQRGVLAAAGPWDDDSGALLIFRLDETAVRAEIDADPYYTAPGVRIVSIRRWVPVVGP
jgi:hypothetical protein